MRRLGTEDYLVDAVTMAKALVGRQDLRRHRPQRPLPHLPPLSAKGGLTVKRRVLFARPGRRGAKPCGK